MSSSAAPKSATEQLASALTQQSNLVTAKENNAAVHETIQDFDSDPCILDNVPKPGATEQQTPDTAEQSPHRAEWVPDLVSLKQDCTMLNKGLEEVEKTVS